MTDFSKLKKSLLPFVLVFLTLLSRFAVAERVDLNGGFVVAGRIDGLVWNSKRAWRDSATDPTVHVRLEGNFGRPNWSLISNNVPIPLASGGNLVLDLDLHSGSPAIEVLAVGPEGEVEMQTIALLDTDFIPQAPDSEKNKVEPEKDKPEPAKLGDAAESARDWFPVDRRLSLSTGYVGTTFKQTGLLDLKLGSLPAKLEVSFPLFSNQYEVGLDTLFNLAGFSNNRSGFQVNFLESRAKVGRLFSAGDSAWTFAPYAEFIYSTMFVTNEAFGYENVTGEGIGLELRKIFANRFQWRLGVSFDFLNQNFAFSSRDLETYSALGYRFTARSQGDLVVGYSDVSLPAMGADVKRMSFSTMFRYSFFY